MYYRQKTLGRMGASLQPAATNYTVPASTGGINALDPLISLPPVDCFYTFNLMPSEYGLRLRKGYREWATGVGTANTEVRSIIPFEGVEIGNNKLFAVTADGVFDVTADGTTAPSQVVVFTDTSGSAGYCVWTEMTLDNGDQRLFIADGRNGIYQYDEGTNAWSRPVFTGVDAQDCNFVILHKQRLWVSERLSGDAYYGPVDSVAGAFTKFTFGSKFKYGGELICLANWTLDGGDGVDDYFIAISRGGDVLSYRGSDPSATDWQLTGTFFVGEVPDSRRITQQYAGQLLILSTFGITSLQDLVNGIDATDTVKSPSAKINRILRAEVETKKRTLGWQMSIHPADGFLQVLEPWTFEVDATQYTQNLLTGAWGYWRDVPAKCSETWQAGYYMGGPDGQVYFYDGTLDNTTIAGGAGVGIQYSILTSFQAVGDHAAFKQIGLVRVVGVVSGDASYNMKIVYDYDILGEAGPPDGQATTAIATWDAGIWDAAVWDGPLTGDSEVQGGNGIGRTVAVAMKGDSQSRITIVGWDLTVTTGGFL